CNDANESSTIIKKSPSLSTNAGDDKVLGVNGSDLSDSATLSGATADATGTITFHLYFGADCSPANEVTGSPVTNTLVNGDGTYGSPAIHVTKAGTYRWVANYGGDANHNPTPNGCNGDKENVVVSPRRPSPSTTARGRRRPLPPGRGRQGRPDRHRHALRRHGGCDRHDHLHALRAGSDPELGFERRLHRRERRRPGLGDRRRRRRRRRLHLGAADHGRRAGCLPLGHPLQR